jgi:hypothetical protein
MHPLKKSRGYSTALNKKDVGDSVCPRLYSCISGQELRRQTSLKKPKKLKNPKNRPVELLIPFSFMNLESFVYVFSDSSNGFTC